MKTQLTKHQIKTYGPKPISGYGTGAQITATVRHDDRCGNGHNTFSVTAEVRIPGRRDIEAGGCMHKEIAKHFPELAPFIKWHLTSTDGPMHYTANTLYHAKQSAFNYARSTAIWPDATDVELIALAGMPHAEAETILNARLVPLMAEFRAAVGSLGFIY
jgi:hypothetical protein